MIIYTAVEYAFVLHIIFCPLLSSGNVMCKTYQLHIIINYCQYYTYNITDLFYQ